MIAGRVRSVASLTLEKMAPSGSEGAMRKTRPPARDLSGPGCYRCRRCPGAHLLPLVRAGGGRHLDSGYGDAAETHGRIEAFGVEGTGSYGAGLARAVRRAGHRVVEVNRGDRCTRRATGKSDTIDILSLQVFAALSPGVEPDGEDPDVGPSGLRRPAGALLVRPQVSSIRADGIRAPTPGGTIPRG